MIYLDNDLLIGEGCHRKCFMHPDDPRFCVKVGNPGYDKELDREKAYYAKLRKQNIQWLSLAGYHGETDTKLGSGDIFDLIKDDNSNPSHNLEHYLNNVVPEGTEEALKNLKEYLLENRILTTAIKPRNIVLQMNSDRVEKAVIVDDIGNTEFLPLSNISKFLAHRKIERKWERFTEELARFGLEL